MPNYSYKCGDCRNKFKVDASIEEKEKGGTKFHCPKCKSKNTKQVFSLGSFFSAKDEGKKGGGGCCCSGGCQ